MIPKTLHFIWFGCALPDWVGENIDEFKRLSPGWDVRVHGVEVLLPEYQEAFDATQDVCTKADILAVSALQRYGGYYLDTDFWPFRSMDALVETYGLDGSKMFVTEQHGMRDPKYKIANGVLGAATDWNGWGLVRDKIINHNMPILRCDFGPTLFTKLVDTHPELFSVGPWPWFYPAEIGRALELYGVCRNGTANRYARHWSPTHGQLPFMMHLWAGGSTTPKPPLPKYLLARLDGSPVGEFAGYRALIGVVPQQWTDTTQPFQAIARGLQSLGFNVDIERKDNEKLHFDAIDLFFVWNGRKGIRLNAVQQAKAAGVPCVVFEHGFLGNRRANTHIDNKGILHWASWANDWDCELPDGAVEKLAAVCPSIKPSLPRKDGYVLVLGQVDGDSQLDGCVPDRALQLAILVKHALPAGIKAAFRPHPLMANRKQHVLPTCEHKTLAESLEHARFAITINSNSGNDCLVAGVPVLCIGNSLYKNAGVALSCTDKTLAAAVTKMLNGWCPDQERVNKYLALLASRQYNQSEFEDGSALLPVIHRALNIANKPKRILSGVAAT